MNKIKRTSWNKGIPCSEETKKKQSDSLKLAYKEGRMKFNINFNHKGFKHSDKTKEEMRLAKLGTHQTKEVIEKRVKSYKDFWSKDENKIKLLNRNKKIGLSEKGKVIPNSVILIRKGKSLIEQYGKDKSNEIIKKIIEARAKQIFPAKDTSIEIKIQTFLKQMNIDFFTHQHININHAYQCDILIPSLNTVIECDGDYWHKYPIGNDIDHLRTKELLEKGFRVLRLWEYEIKAMKLNDFKERLSI
jgi:very-short-patch-repair endonuclease